MKRTPTVGLTIIILIVLIGIISRIISAHAQSEQNSVIINTFIHMLGRKPTNKEVDAAEVDKVASLSGNKDGFMNSAKSTPRRSTVERMMSALDPTKTIEFQAWRDWLQRGDVTVDEFKSILQNSNERHMILYRAVEHKMSYNAGGAPCLQSEVEGIIPIINPKVDFSVNNANVAAIINAALEQARPRVYTITKLANMQFRNVVKPQANAPQVTLENIVAKATDNKNIDTTAQSIDDLLKSVSPEYGLWAKLKEDPELYNNTPEALAKTIVANMKTRAKNEPTSSSAYRWSPEGIPEFSTLKFSILTRKMLHRNPTLAEQTEIQDLKYADAMAADSTAFITSWITNNTEYANIDAVIRKEIISTYTNLVFKPPSPETVDSLYKEIQNGKIMREDLHKAIKELDAIRYRDKNLTDMIIISYKSALGRYPTNAEVKQFAAAVSKDSTIDATTIFTKYFTSYNINAAAYDPLNDKILLFRGGGVEIRAPTTFDLVSAMSYPKFNRRFGVDFGLAIASATTNPLNRRELLIITKTNDVYAVDLTPSNTLAVVYTNNAAHQHAIQVMLRTLGISADEIAGLVPYYVSKYGDELLVFLRSGEYLMWNVVTNSFRHRSAIADNKTAFNNFGLPLDDVSAVSYFDKASNRLMFIQQSTNTAYFWDPVNSHEVVTNT